MLCGLLITRPAPPTDTLASPAARVRPAAAAPLLAEDGLLYVESPREIGPPDGFSIWRRGRAGAVHYQLLRREDNPAP